MNKIRIIFLMSLLGLVLSGCNVEKDDLINQEKVIDYSNSTVFELLELSDKIKFIGKNDGADILANADDIFTRLSRNDRLMVFGQNPPENYGESIKFFFSSLLEWDREFMNTSELSTDDRDEYEKEEEKKLEQLIGGDIAQKNRIVSIVLEIEDYFYKNDLNMPDEINIAKYENLFELEYAFNVDNTIFLSDKLLLSHKEKIKEELTKQLFYLYLNKNPQVEEELLAQMGFVKTHEFLVDEKKVANKYTNPNAPKSNYVFKGKFAGQDLSFLPISYIENTDDEFVKYEIINKYYSVDISQEEIKFLNFNKSNIRDDNGGPIEVDLSEIDNFNVYFLSSSYDFKHPRIIASEYFVDLINKSVGKEVEITRKFKEILEK